MAWRWLDRALPGRCLLCGGDAGPGEGAVCAGCAADLPGHEGPACPVCAQPLATAGVCGPCLRRPPAFDATRALWRYEFPADRLIQSLKYARRLAAADFLGHALAAAETGAPPDCILPVPLAPGRLAERGFNQALELARPLARRLGVPLDLDGVARQERPPQADLSRRQRAANVRHAFEVRREFTGLHVWLVDDVMTSGATLDELARVLKRHGAARVENRVIARAARSEGPV